MGENSPPWGRAPIPSSSNQRRIPEWMDPSGEHGEMQFLLLKPTPPNKIPTYPFIISKTIELAAGQIAGGHPCDKGQAYLLKVRSPKQVEKLLAVNQLIDSTPISITVHPSLNTCKCVVTCPEAAGATNEQLAEDLASQGVTNVYRFINKTDGKETPTNTFVLTIRGTTVPTHIRFGFLQARTRPYYPRPMICLQCGKFGHTKKYCKNELICLICGDNEIHPNCKLPSNCVNCQNAHPSNSRSCPVFKTEQEIIKIRTDLGISHAEAIKEHRNRQNRNTSIQQRLILASTSSSTESKDQEIAELRRQVVFLTAQIATFSQQAKEMEQDDDTLNNSESDSSTDSNKSTVSKTSIAKRFWKTSSDDSPSGTSSKPQEPKKKRKRRPETTSQPNQNSTVRTPATTHNLPPNQRGKLNITKQS